MSTEYSITIANTISRCLKENELNFSFDSDKGSFGFDFTIKGKIKKLRFLIKVYDDCFTSYATSPIGSDVDTPDSIAAMSEFICRANYGLRNGNFEFDARDGEISYKCHVPCKDILPSRTIIADSIYIPAYMFEHYSDGIVDVIFNNSSAEDAINKCEN